MAPANEPGSDGQTDRRRRADSEAEGGTWPGRAHLLLAIKLGLKWARALKEAAAAPAAAAANSAAGVIVAAPATCANSSALLCHALSRRSGSLSAATLSLTYVAATQTHWTAERSYSRLALTQGACSLSAANGFAL